MDRQQVVDALTSLVKAAIFAAIYFVVIIFSYLATASWVFPSIFFNVGELRVAINGLIALIVTFLIYYGIAYSKKAETEENLNEQDS